ncbi:hypothetical protein [Aquimarina sp. I32.4]|uniref:hypothetical protein n=1 Tax=Aquimarina sp. I32.4 TaxID=2053903 RepID=UPI000CDE60A9|nr:hypothetical protein [Aquimarina sp. I32.4]
MKKISVFIIFISLLSISCFDSHKKEGNILKGAIEFNTSQVPDVSEAIPTNQKSFDSIKSGLNFKPASDYNKTKQEIAAIRKDLNDFYQTEHSSQKKEVTLDSAMHYFTTSLLNDIIPYWYGTAWDFNGYTNIPNQGEIACGYFVSTTLKHMGLRLNRYRMAQQASKLEVESIAIQKNKVIVSNEKNISEKLKELQEGLYIVGLDNHVGYIYIHNKVSYFIHSSYITDRVMIELTSESNAFPSSVYYMTSITDNRIVAKKWLLGETLKIKTQ